MCYDIKTSLEKQLRRAILDGNLAQFEEINEKLSIFSPDEIELNHVSGFSHPQMIIYTSEAPFAPTLATWGLVPSWVRDEQQKNAIWNKTLNARGEKIWEKPSFRSSAKNKRCIIYIEGFYEHRHLNGKTFPYYIYHKEKDLLPVAGLYSKWFNPDAGHDIHTFSIVTTKANELMTTIHNNPKLKEPRMPLLLIEETQEEWLRMVEEPADKKLIEELIKPYPDHELNGYTVSRIRGKDALGNVEEATNEVIYPEIIKEDNELTLF
ncbi:MAG: SOS response-associated peptidase [Bacteroidia bacterium]|nr:SOS response-associated peptidase [Bacteroidia bacterium]NNJ56525.1 SOS response-associated peptidase [Bacteroidia bacterium]